MDRRVNIHYQEPEAEPEALPSRSAAHRSKKPWVVFLVVVVLFGGLGFVFRTPLKQTLAGAFGKQASTQYQAVFLTNAQVYFGKLTDANDTYAALSDIYYLQVVQQQLQGQSSQGTKNEQANQTPQFSLVKLGNELHGPEDEMKISRQQILFYEDLRADSEVVKAITEYKDNPRR